MISLVVKRAVRAWWKNWGYATAALAVCVVGLASGCERTGRDDARDQPGRGGMFAASDGAAPGQAQVRAEERPNAERGRYLVRVGGCNDCHTPGFMEKGPGVPEEVWLTGVPVGWRGPWGTTYASNLRLFVKDFDEDTFVQVVRARNSRPPMPWPNLHAMEDRDLRSVFRYIRSLPATGERMPEWVPPGKEPATAYVEMMPQMPKASASAQ